MAGAKVQMEPYHGSALNGCADSEQEEDDWQHHGGGHDEPYACSTFIAHAGYLDITNRRRDYHQMARIDHIRRLILNDTTAPSCAAIEKAIDTAVRRQNDYTVEQLVRIQGSLSCQGMFASNTNAKLCLDRRAACESEESNLSAILLLVSKGAKSDEPGLLADRRYWGRTGETSLYAVAKLGHRYWWLTEQALPLMLGQKVDLEVRDIGEHTPLNASLKGMSAPLWHSRITEMLLRAGANPLSMMIQEHPVFLALPGTKPPGNVASVWGSSGC
ncbi:hypothetical protein FGRMN_7670 [Fusarium graminum]|nr:hypothetical protein FGRMN_7670 [Fusarium graminum]